MVKAGGTSVPEPRAGGGWLAFVVVAPVAAYLVHRISSGDECGWDYGSVGGACRAIILLSVVAGAVVGFLAVAAARAMRASERRRARVLAIVAVVLVVLATLAAKQFQDYRHAGMRTMDEPMCKFVNAKLMTCVRTVMGEEAYNFTRRAQDGCLADDRSIAEYRKCMAIEDCAAVVDCVAKFDPRP